MVALASDHNLGLRFLRVRALTESVARPLSAEDCCVQSMPDASPTKWHLAHTSWFFETFLLAAAAGYRPYSDNYGFLFNSYYDGLGKRQPRAARGLLSRPSLEEVTAYRRYVTERVLTLLESRRAEQEDCRSLVELGINHEQQHQELMVTDIKHLLGSHPFLPAYRATAPSSKCAPNAMNFVDFDGGLVSVGHEGRGFSFDNEQPSHRVFLQPFQLASRLVTNGEYLEFMRDGGYERPELWLSDGFQTAADRGWAGPLYWSGGLAEPRAYSLTGDDDLSLDEPVCHVSHYEADAYARWAGARLPTEFEWERAAEKVPVGGNLLDRDELHPCPATDSASSIQQLFGDTWEWTQSAYTAYPGYARPSGPIGEYNGKFMCNQWVLRGGSCATPADHIRATYRNYFPPDARWQFTGIRLARSR